MENSDDSIPDNWEDEAEEVTQEEAASWKKEVNYVFKTEADTAFSQNAYSSLLNQDEQLSSHYSNKKDSVPKEPLPKKELIIRPKLEEVIEKIDKKALISSLIGRDYQSIPSKTHVNIVFIGHVDAGKSTLCGNIIYRSKKIDQRVVEMYELEAKENNRESWWLAYIMDVNTEEREKGITIEVGRAFIETEHRVVCMLDAPGHKSFVPNMISGAAQADIAALVVSARPGEFESGFQKGGQTTEHILLCRAMGVDSFIVLVTKMDTVNWDEERFRFIQKSLIPFLVDKCKLSPQQLHWIPISGLDGTNLLLNEGGGWYTGKGFLQVLDECEVGGKDENAPLRVPILDKAKEMGTVVLGKVEAGIVVKGMKVNLMPGNCEAEVQEILGVEDERIMFARPGMNVRIKLKGSDEFKPGSVLCDPYDFPIVSETFVADIMVLDLLPHKPLLIPGYVCIIHLGVAVSECTFDFVISATDPKTKKHVKANYIRANMRAKAILRVKEPMCFSVFSELSALGKFALRDEDITIGLGKILEVR